MWSSCLLSNLPNRILPSLDTCRAIYFFQDSSLHLLTGKWSNMVKNEGLKILSSRLPFKYNNKFSYFKEWCSFFCSHILNFVTLIIKLLVYSKPGSKYFCLKVGYLILQMQLIFIIFRMCSHAHSTTEPFSFWSF